MVTRALGTASLRYTGLLIGLVLSALIARTLGPEGRGQYYYPILLVLTLQTCVSLSLDSANLFLRSQRNVPLARLVGQAGMSALLVGAVGIVCGLVGWFTLQDSLIAGVPFVHFAVALAPLPLALHTIYLTGLLVLTGRVIVPQGILLAGTVIQVAALAGLLLGRGGAVTVTTVLALNSVAQVIVWGLTLRATRRLAPVRPRWHPDLATETWRFGLQMHGGVVLFFLATRLDAYLVKQLLGLTMLGYYSLAMALADLVNIATTAVSAAVLPRQAEGTLADAAPVTAKACRLNLALAAVLSLGLTLAAYPLVVIAYGRAFLPSIVPLLLLIPGVAAASLIRPLIFYLVRLGRPLVTSAIGALSAVISLVLNLVLIPLLGIAGAAVAASLSMGFLAMCQLIWFRRHSGLPLREVLWLDVGDLKLAWPARRMIEHAPLAGRSSPEP
jgi:O-antigen/teichoic acid export membrane protein